MFENEYVLGSRLENILALEYFRLNEVNKEN